MKSNGHLVSEKREIYKTYNDYEGRLICPDCSEKYTKNIIELRRDYWECLKCGYKNDIDFWYKNKKITPPKV